jgi:hypothetical protein
MEFYMYVGKQKWLISLLSFDFATRSAVKIQEEINEKKNFVWKQLWAIHKIGAQEFYLCTDRSDEEYWWVFCLFTTSHISHILNIMQGPIGLFMMG